MSEYLSLCPQCSQRILCDTRYAGQRVACPVCLREIIMPALPESAQVPSSIRPTTPTSPKRNFSGALIGVAVILLSGFVAWAWHGRSEKIPLIASPVATKLPLSGGLVHRYSFSESGGRSVADSVGGPAWSGLLPNGGAFAGGQLTLSSNSQQYVQLPPGLIDPNSMTAVTIEAWATFPPNLPWTCWLFGFGTSTNDDAGQYIMCSSGRNCEVISGTFPGWANGGEQQVGDGMSWANRTMHITCVINPPAGFIAIYTNGVLANCNNAETYPLSVVLDRFSYINRSLYAKDALINLTINEFRIYNRALSSDEITITEKLGPDQLLNGLH